MRILFWIVGGLCAIGAFFVDAQAKSAIHQILAQIGYLIAVVLIVGAEIVGAISAASAANLKALSALSQKLDTNSVTGRGSESDRFAVSDVPGITRDVEKLRDAGFSVMRGAYSGWKVTDRDGNVFNISTEAELSKFADKLA